MFPQRIKKFKRKITEITYPKKKKPVKAIVELLNNQILGFGHWYKLASARQNFTKIDAFIRKRLRVYLVQASQKPILANLYLTNNELGRLDLKSLVKVFEKHQEKTKKSKPKTGKKAESEIRYYKPAFIDSIKEKQLFNLLGEITKKQEKIEKRLKKIEKNWKR